ncbi:hypothetical protein [Foetidibacter luteolus]|uniref:hypothetical protein n=1 Tax=Foetidibacter luteolus TaxID=2608880 RepID=UPI00129A58C0|nr:hypothetical protein [Foetidibacter luteolus]
MLGLFKKKLPHCDILFEKFLSPWYPEVDRPKMTRPDMYQIAAFEGEPLDFDALQYLEGDFLADRKKFINKTMVEAALGDFQKITSSMKIDLTALDAVDKFYDRKKIAELIKESDPTDFSNPYLVTVCEFGVMLGQLFRQIEGFDWLYSNPYFHSIIVHKDTGFGITVFDWAVKKFSEYGVDDGFVAKFHAALEAINEYKANPGK